MTKSVDTNSKQPIHLRYVELYQTNLVAKDKVKKLEEMKGEISEDRYESLLSQQEAIVSEADPQLADMRNIIESRIAELSREVVSIVNNIKAIDGKIKESEKLYKAGLIDKDQYSKDVKPLNQELKRWKTGYSEKNNECSVLKKALEPPTVGGDRIQPKPEKDTDVSRSPLTRTLSIASRYFQGILCRNKYLGMILGNSTNYLQRFLAFLVITEVLCLLLFVVIKLSGSFGLSAMGPIAMLSFLVIGIVLMTVFLFQGVKAGEFTCFSTAIVYVLVSAFIVSRVGMDRALSAIGFLGLWAAWNFVFSTVILFVTTSRAFFLRLKSSRFEGRRTQ